MIKVCSIHMELISPEKMGLAGSLWAIWKRDLGDENATKWDAKIVEGAPQAAEEVRSLIDAQIAMGYRVFYNSKEIK